MPVCLQDLSAVLTLREGARQCNTPMAVGSLLHPAEEQLGHCHIANSSQIIPWDWSCAGTSTKGGSREENSRKRQHQLHLDAGGVVETLRCLNCNVVREASSQRLV